MKALIEIGGDWQDVYTTAYIHHKYKANSKPDYIDTQSVMNDGYDSMMLIGEHKSLNLKIANSPEYEDRSFMFIHVTKPTQMFDESKVRCNVPIVIRRTHSLFGWCVYFYTLMVFNLKSKFNKK